MIEIFVINLDRDKGKRRHIEALFARHNLKFTRIEAVDGHQLDNEKIQLFASQSKAMNVMGRVLTSAEIGVALSHMLIYSRMIEEKIDKVVILEDDIEFNNSFSECLKYTAQLPIDWEVVLLGHRAIQSAFVEASSSLWSQKKIGEIFHCIRFAEFPFGTHGYLINRKGAEKMLKVLQPLVEPIDHYTGDDTVVNLYGISPVCIRLNAVLEKQSNVSEERDQLTEQLKHPDSKLKQMIKHIPYLVKTGRVTERFLRRLKRPNIYKETSLRL